MHRYTEYIEHAVVCEPYLSFRDLGLYLRHDRRNVLAVYIETKFCFLLAILDLPETFAAFSAVWAGFECLTAIVLVSPF